MALAEVEVELGGEIPEDSFRVRIAVIRAMKGWNVKQAGEACDIHPENWRLWEKTGRNPQNYEEVCRKIAIGSGYDRAWIASGGSLRSRCFYLVPNSGQMELSFDAPPFDLVAV